MSFEHKHDDSGRSHVRDVFCSKLKEEPPVDSVTHTAEAPQRLSLNQEERLVHRDRSEILERANSSVAFT